MQEWKKTKVEKSGADLRAGNARVRKSGAITDGKP